MAYPQQYDDSTVRRVKELYWDETRIRNMKHYKRPEGDLTGQQIAAMVGIPPAAVYYIVAKR